MDLYTRPHRDCDVNPDPLMTVLNFSGGKQSSAILWMLIRGELITRPKNLLVMTADPGMENSETYDYVSMMHEKCREAGIETELAAGPDLLKDLLTFKETGKARLDYPPYYTKDRETGKLGRLKQGCTKHYKIAPMDRALRRHLEARSGISRKSKRIPHGAVEKWIGFAYDEYMRIKEPTQKYVQFHYPLMPIKYRTEEVLAYFRDRGLPLPPRSVCNACFANSVATFKEMHDNRPDDWAQAVAVDEAIRDSRQIGVKQECYVSKTLIPLREMAARDFKLSKDETVNDSCDSGYCFT